jgi:hypothetical protein
LTIKQTVSADESAEPAHLVEAFRFLQKNPEIFSRHLDQMLTEPPASDNPPKAVNYLDVPRTLRHLDVSITLQRLAAQLSDEAGTKGISIDAVGLHAYLLTKAVTTKRNDVAPDRPVDWSVLTQKLTEGMTTGLVIGNHVFDLTKREDGSVRIVTNQGGHGSSTLILDKDGGIKFERTLMSNEVPK